jgi:hypothetical protein
MDATARTPLRLALGTGLFDDASMYPPARAPMEAALSLHRTTETSPWAIFQGRFLCPAGELRRLPDERALLGLTGPLEVGAVIGSPADPSTPVDLTEVAAAAAALPRWSPGVRVASVEYRPVDQSPDGVTTAIDELVELALRTGMAQVAVEVAVAGRDPAAVRESVEAASSGRHRHGDLLCAKVRCGGLDASLVPTADELAAFVIACAQAELPFKATAGLHHALAVAGGDDRRHGYLNLIAATAAALAGAPPDDVVACLRFDDTEALTATEDTLELGPVTLDVVSVGRTRRDGLLSFGTCSFTEPLADLLALV